MLTFQDRARALEDIFFQQVDHQLLYKLRDEEESRQLKQELHASCGICNEELLDELARLHVQPATILAVTLIPLIVVAWADGKLSKEEQEQILEAERAQGIDEGSAADQLLQSWLYTKPKPELFETWKSFINELRSHLSATNGVLLDREIIELCDRIAHASGGYWSYGAVSPSEQKAIREIKETLEHHPSN